MNWAKTVWKGIPGCHRLSLPILSAPVGIEGVLNGWGKMENLVQFQKQNRIEDTTLVKRCSLIGRLDLRGEQNRQRLRQWPFSSVSC